MSLTIPSDLDTPQPYIGVVAQGKQGKFTGATLHWETLTAMLAAISVEQTNAATATIWVNGQSLMADDEGFTRKWSRTNNHARKMLLPGNNSITFAADTNRMYTTSGLPASGVGANGDYAIDTVAGYLYLKAAGAWAITPVSIPNAGGPVTGVTYDGSFRVATYVQNGITYTCTYLTSGNGTGKLGTLVGGGRTITYSYNLNGDVTGEVWS